MSFSRLSTVSRSDQVRDQLESAIRRGDYAPGDKLPSERELTEMLGVSRVSVREGIRSLEAIGLVEVRHGNGCFVLDPARRTGRELGRWLDLHRDAVIELLVVRAPLDELAAGLAAERRDREALARVRAAHEAFLAEIGRGRVDELSDLDIAFHVAIARASGSDLLYDLLDDLHQHLRESRKAGFEVEGHPARAGREHVAIVDAIERGDAEAARRSVSEHVARVRRVLESE
jgi:GntR family transcriptional repressor for pyruvate dehydrogenase complex